MFWWEREGCRVRRGEEGNKKKERGIEKEEKGAAGLQIQPKK